MNLPVEQKPSFLSQQEEDSEPIPVLPFENLDEALASLITCLNRFVPLRIWMVTRVVGDDWIVLSVHDDKSQVAKGALFHWPDSYCARMVKGDGPHFAEQAQRVPAYATAPMNKLMPIQAYVGQPLTTPDGALLGTLCAADPKPQAEFSASQRLLVETISRTISTLLTGELKIEEARQAQSHLEYLAQRDELTQVSNRRGWESALAREEPIMAALGENAMVMVVDLDGLKKTNDSLGHAAGDKYLVAAAHALSSQTRQTDVVARVGGDEFAVLLRGLTKREAETMCARMRLALSQAGVAASVGFAMRLSTGSLSNAMTLADERMYIDKAQRKTVMLW